MLPAGVRTVSLWNTAVVGEGGLLHSAILWLGGSVSGEWNVHCTTLLDSSSSISRNMGESSGISTVNTNLSNEERHLLVYCFRLSEVPEKSFLVKNKEILESVHGIEDLLLSKHVQRKVVTIKGLLYDVGDFCVRVGSLEVGATTFGTVVEIEYKPGCHLQVCREILNEFASYLWNTSHQLQFEKKNIDGTPLAMEIDTDGTMKSVSPVHYSPAGSAISSSLLSTSTKTVPTTSASGFQVMNSPLVLDGSVAIQANQSITGQSPSPAVPRMALDYAADNGFPETMPADDILARELVVWNFNLPPYYSTRHVIGHYALFLSANKVL